MENPQALCVQNDILGIPSFLAVFCGNETSPSEIIHVSGGTAPSVSKCFNLSISLLKCRGPLSVKDQHCSASLEVRPCSRGRPSGIVSNLKSGQDLMESTDPDLRRRSCMYYVLMKVIKKPQAYNNLESYIMA